MNSGLIRSAIELGAEQMDINFINISGFPLYNQDMEAAFPEEITKLKKQIREADGVIIATPEYNRSIPGALKNMLDWTSRPYGDNPWDGKVVVTMGASPGSIGTALAQYHLKQILLYLNARLSGQPEFYVNNASEKFDKEGNLTDAKTREHIESLLKSFEQRSELLKTF
jgi:chromate reductase